MILYRRVLVIAAVGILYSGFANYVNVTTGIDPAPMHWIFLITVLAIPLIFRRETGEQLLRSPVALWGLFFIGMGLLGWFPAADKDLALQDLRWRTLTVIELAVYTALFADASALTVARWAVAMVVAVGSGVNMYEMMFPDVGFSSVRGRAAGLYMNSNASGVALVLGMILSLTSLPNRLRVPFILITAAGVATTISRSSIIMLVVSVAGFLTVRRVNGKNLLTWLCGGMVLATLLLLPKLDSVLTTMQREGVINKNLEERLDWFSNPTGVSDFSSWERQYLARRAWEEVAVAPILGNGTGSSWRPLVGAHNQYLTMMQDHGVMGAAILPLLVLAVTWRARGEAKIIAWMFGLSLLFLGFFSHNILYQEVSLVSIALMTSTTQLSRVQQHAIPAVQPTTSESSSSSLQFG
jgi:hypothetical protein